jgi:putative transposase
VKVNPKNTSQVCAHCGAMVPKQLGDRWHLCPSCGFSAPRDHNSALNLLRLGRNLCASAQEAHPL